MVGPKRSTDFDFRVPYTYVLWRLEVEQGVGDGGELLGCEGLQPWADGLMTGGQVDGS